MSRAFVLGQFTGFLAAGCMAAAVNFGSRILYNRWVDYSTAIVLAYVTGMITAYVLSRCFVFKGGTQTWSRSIFYFVLVNLLAVAQTWAVSLLLAYFALPAMGVARHVKEIAHAIGLAVPILTSYLGHKHFSFR